MERKNPNLSFKKKEKSAKLFSLRLPQSTVEATVNEVEGCRCFHCYFIYLFIVFAAYTVCCLIFRDICIMLGSSRIVETNQFIRQKEGRGTKRVVFCCKSTARQPINSCHKK